MPATIGISTASATICSIVPSNWPTTLDARNAVPRLMPSQTMRRRNARGTGREQVFVLVEAGGAQRLVLGLLADDVDDVVDGDAAEQDVVVVDDRRADPVVVGELARDLVRGFVHVDRRLLVVDQLVDRRVGLVRQQRLQRDAAEVLVAAADDVQVVGVLGQFAAQAQVAQHDVDGGVGAHRHHVGVHQAAGGVLVVRQHLLEALAVLAVHRLEDFVDDGVGQVLDQVGEVVDVEVFDRGDDLVRVHVREQAFAHFVADVHQHFAVVLGIDQAPHHRALGRRQRFEQVADLGRGRAC